MIDLFLFLFLFSLALTYIIKVYATKKSLIAIPNERSSHTVPTPHGGGVAIAITWFVGLSFLYINDVIDNKLFYALLSGLIISIVSFFDDLFELSAKVRLVSQVLVSVLGLYFLGGLKELDFGLITISNDLLLNAFSLFMIVWFINLYNFLDGIDGYAGTEMAFLAISGFMLFGGNHFLILLVSVVGFLILNWDKAQIFMGDVGSTLLGFNVAIFTLYYANIESSNFWIWITLFGLFWFDATLTLIRRFFNNESLSVAHKKHAYQRLTQAGWSHGQVVLASLCINIILFVLVYFIADIMIAFFISLVLLYSIIKVIDKKKPF